MNNRLEMIERLDRLLAQLTNLELKPILRRISNPFTIKVMEETLNVRPTKYRHASNSQK